LLYVKPSLATNAFHRKPLDTPIISRRISLINMDQPETGENWTREYTDEDAAIPNGAYGKLEHTYT
jgi:hypothetical protein